jgi:hypothetical protein
MLVVGFRKNKYYLKNIEKTRCKLLKIKFLHFNYFESFFIFFYNTFDKQS